MTNHEETKERVNVLLVDDKPSNLIALESILCGSSYNVISVTSGAAGLAALEIGNFAVILTDVMMPIMDGFEFASRVKKSENFSDIPIIFLTAMASDIADIFYGYEVGAVDYLPKPLVPEIVKAKVDVFVQLYRQKLVIKRQAEELLENEWRERARVIAELQQEALIEHQRTDSFLRTIARKKRIQQLQDIQLQATRIFAESTPLEDAVPKLLETICRGISWDWGALWNVDEASGRLTASHFWHKAIGQLAALETSCRDTELTITEEPYDQITKTGSPAWIPNTAFIASNHYRNSVAAEMKSGVLAPIWVGDKIVAVAEFLHRESTPKDSPLMAMLAEIGTRIGLYIMRKRAEIQLSESEERFRLLVAGVKDYAIFMLDTQGKVTTWNPGAERINGYSYQDIIGKSVDCLYTPESIQEGGFEKEFEEAIAHGHVENEQQRIRKDGSRFWAHSLTTPVYDSNGRLKGFSRITRDITERKKAEDRLRRLNEDLEQRIDQRTRELLRQEVQLRTITNAMPVLVAEIDTCERIKFANDACRKFFSHSSPNQLLGMRLYDLLTDDEYESIHGYIKEAFTGVRVSFEREVFRGNERFVFNVALIPETDENRQVGTLIFVATDVTQYKQIEEALIQAKSLADSANSAKSAFLANMSHEIRTPLGAVLGFSELLLNRELSDQEQSLYISAMRRNGNLLSTIINDILDLSKVEAGKIDVELQSVTLEDILTDVSALLSLQAAEKGILLTVTHRGPVPNTIFTDPLRLRQILHNIVGNAVKFTAAGRVEVTVLFEPSASSGRPVLLFEVSDTGPGISSDQAAKIFQPFTQADPSTKRKYGGTGLGLVLAKRLANILGGDVVLKETAKRRGSTFLISIDPGEVVDPFSQATIRQENLAGLAVQKISEPRLDGASVLLVEDAVDNRMLVGRFLKVAGALVDTAENGAEAVKKINDKTYDAVLMDLQMPVMDGYEAIAELRRGGHHLPVIALTAHAMKEDRLRCIEAGFNDHICKPINRSILIERVSEHIERARYHAKNLVENSI